VDGTTAVISSVSGRQHVDNETGDQFVVLQNGNRYEGQPGHSDFAIIKFEEYGVRVKEKEVLAINYKHYSTPTRGC